MWDSTQWEAEKEAHEDALAAQWLASRVIVLGVFDATNASWRWCQQWDSEQLAEAQHEARIIQNTADGLHFKLKWMTAERAKNFRAATWSH